jgi:MFS superfamily sulfate permease-like transporter
MLQPIAYYLRNHSVAEWMIYRFLVADLLATSSCLVACASYITDRIVSISLFGEISGRTPRRVFCHRNFWLIPTAFTLAGLALVLASLFQLLRTGSTFEHWSRYVVMSFCFSVAIILWVTKGVDFVLDQVAHRVQYIRDIQQTRDPQARHLTTVG